MGFDRGFKGIDLGVEELVSRAACLHIADEFVASKDPINGDRDPRKGDECDDPSESCAWCANAEERMENVGCADEVQ